MEKTLSITDAFYYLGVNPYFVYSLTLLCILLFILKRINEAWGMVVMLSIPYVSALTVLGEIRGAYLYFILISSLVILVVRSILELVLGRDRYREFVIEQLPFFITGERPERDVNDVNQKEIPK